MRGENALAADFFDVLATNGSAPRLLSFFSQQFQRKQPGVALIHVESREVVIAQRAQHAHAANPEDHFLAKPIIGISSVQRSGEIPVEFAIRRQVGVQEIHRHFKSVNALHGVSPASKFEAAILDRHAGARRFLSQEIVDAPVDRLFGL